MPENGEMPRITTLEPVGKAHELVNTKTLEGVSMDLSKRNQMIPLFEYLQKENTKPRGTEGIDKDLNSHKETFIVRQGNEIKLKDLSELQEMLRLAGFNADLLGVQSIGNANQKITAVVQGVDPNNPKSGFERPTIAEGPHMVLAPYAYDRNGKLHVFRTIQYRTGSAGIDTARGFMDAQTLASGEYVTKIEGSEAKVKENLGRIIKEEGGEKLLKIKKVDFMGTHKLNKSFVTSPSALFSVEVDYDTFSQLKNVVSTEEAARRKREAEHEGLSDIIIDMTPEQYVNYKTDPTISKDMGADFATDIVVMRNLFQELQKKSTEIKPVVVEKPVSPLSVSIVEKPKKGGFLSFFRRKTA